MFVPLKRIIVYGFKNFRRQPTLNIATIFILVISLTLFSCLLVFQSGIKYIISEIEKRIDVSVYLKEDAPTEVVEEIKKGLLGLEEVEEVEYVSPEEALQKFQERHRDDPLILESLEVIGRNPFYPSLNIRAKSAGQYAAILTFLQRDKFKDAVLEVDYAKKQPLIEKVFRITSSLNMGGFLITIFLSLIAVLVTFNTVRIAIKDSSEKIGIMKLVGASNWYVRGPFIVQGIICGALAGVTTFFLFFLVSYFSAPKIVSLTGGFNIFAWFGSHAFFLFFFQLLLGIGLSVVSCLIAIRKYLNV
ncbi:MAG: permease-like cell division protein FtsX [Candidatus Pacebacteria bacterium]|nr:permease-like cell division protein FtsX [Candidatus Paceibacterota bacterium]